MYFEDRHKIGVFKLIKIYLTTLCINEQNIHCFKFKNKTDTKTSTF